MQWMLDPKYCFPVVRAEQHSNIAQVNLLKMWIRYLLPNLCACTYLCIPKTRLETFAFSFFWKYFLSPESAVIAAILILLYKTWNNNEM